MRTSQGPGAARDELEAAMIADGERLQTEARMPRPDVHFRIRGTRASPPAYAFSDDRRLAYSAALELLDIGLEVVPALVLDAISHA